ncbi:MULTISPECIES: hypothetical protein [unclassified Rathayibacter]|uniref:hypothetical protein n=1 Tax=unclassified Rathayibacter TaxID=2609250 RepID=UPI00188AACB9|nr:MULTISPECIES: hypothetical protein [unclassified Rathayibacter]MBF4461835.1 hypothetical protein [Rathayibacter sp. VKM Ac-2879]MBF4503248.1 hypothetical protein [Rathayibacter sp. VKM Ac-2878]
MSRIRSSEPLPSSAAEERPRLRDSVRLVAPSPQTGASWLVTLDDVPVARVPTATAEVLRLLDGTRPIAEVRRLSEARPEELDALLARVRGAGLLAGGRERSRRCPVRVTPPMTVQFATGRLTPAFAAIATLLRRALRRRGARRVAVVAPVALVVAGIVAAALQAPGLADVVDRPVTVPSLAAVAVALVLATAIHELAHGVTLHLAGGIARRAGFMVFYLTPAFFVDVTDNWRIASRGRRAAVALAGPAVHVVLASASAVVALVVAPGEVRDAALTFTAAATGIALFNLLPFVRFDGYFALVAATDTPRLRERSFEALDAVLGGARGDRRAWLLLLGVGSLITPALLVLAALDRVRRWTDTTGVVGALVLVALDALVLVVLIRGCRRWLRRPGARGRRWALLGTAVALAVALGLLVPVPRTAAVGWFATPEGTRLVSTDAASLARLPAGAEVLLQTQGLLHHRDIGRGVVGPAGSQAPALVPLESLSPVRDPTLIPASGRALEASVAPPTPSAGAALVRLGGDRSLLETVLAPAFTVFGALVPVPDATPQTIVTHPDDRDESR